MPNSYPRARWLLAPRHLVLAAVSSGFFARPALAEPRLDVGGPACAGAAVEMERRLAPALRGLTASGLRAQVVFEADPAGTRVTVTTREHAATRGETVLVVASCEEGLDAAVLVLSLAFGVQDERAEPVDARSAPRVHTRRVVKPAPSAADPPFAAPVPRRDQIEHDHSSAPAGSRLSLAGGLDIGTVPVASAFVAGSVTRFWSAIEVRGSLHYGLPTEQERVETDLRESVQRDFGGVGLATCYAMGSSVRVAGCVGGQFGVVRETRRLQLDGATEVDEAEVTPRVTGTFGVLLGTQRGPIRPELELSGSALAAGRRQGASLVAFRVAAGAAVDF